MKTISYFGHHNYSFLQKVLYFVQYTGEFCAFLGHEV